jgi:hypothetical protein
MQNPDHRGCLEQAGNEGPAIHIGCHIGKALAWMAFALPQPFLSLSKLGP